MNNFSDIKRKLDEQISCTSVILAGLGNSDRADDAFGIELAEQLKLNFPEYVYSESEHSAEGIVYEFLESKVFDLIIFADAVHFNGYPGELRIFEIKDIESFVTPISTHKVPMSLLMGLIQEQKKHSLLLGVQPVSLDFMGEMSTEVSKSLDFIQKYFQDYFQDHTR